MPRQLQRIFQQPPFLQLALFFPLHFPEGEDHFFGSQGLIKEHPYADPAVFFAETAEKFAAEIPYLLAD